MYERIPRVAIVGTGFVGTTTAYKGACRELDLPYDKGGLRRIVNDTRAAGLEIIRAKERRTTALERPWLVLQAPF
jgi:malate/lactate dehydrogenase